MAEVSSIMKIYISGKVYLLTFISSIIQTVIIYVCVSFTFFLAIGMWVAAATFISVWLGFICVILLLRRRLPPTEWKAAGVGAIFGFIFMGGLSILGALSDGGYSLSVLNLDILSTVPCIVMGAVLGLFNYWFWGKMGLI